jgi:hypothetical protein
VAYIENYLKYYSAFIIEVKHMTLTQTVINLLETKIYINRLKTGKTVTQMKRLMSAIMSLGYTSLFHFFFKTYM